MTVCAGCGVDHDAEHAQRWAERDHERMSDRSASGHWLHRVDGITGPHIGGQVCHGSCCDPPDDAALAEFHAAEARWIGDERARRQVERWRPTVQRPEPAPADPTAILDEPDPLDRTSIAGVSLLADSEWCEDCGRAHPPLHALFDRQYVGSFAGVPDDWEEVSIVSVGLDPAGGVVEIAVQFDGGPLTFMSPSALERLGVTVSVS